MRDFNHTVNVLVQAFLNDTLEQCNCYACAVGNLVAAANGYKLVKKEFKLGIGEIAHVRMVPEYMEEDYSSDLRGGHWYKLISVFHKSRDVEVNASGRREIDSTGYTEEELTSVEQAFEHAAGEFEGLMAVVDVLADIHGIDLTVREESKALFKHANVTA